MRRISADVLLGVFRTPGEVESAKARYVRAREADPDADPWKDQRYKDRVPASQDPEVEELPGECLAGEFTQSLADGDAAPAEQAHGPHHRRGVG